MKMAEEDYDKIVIESVRDHKLVANKSLCRKTINKIIRVRSGNLSRQNRIF